jgi:DNA polymerase III subunit beta
MKIRFSKEQFLDGLQQVQNVVSLRTTLPILSNVLIKAEPSGLQLTTTDLDIGVRTTVDAEVSRSGATTLPARKLYMIIRELAASEIELEVDDSHHASIRCGTSFFKIAGLPEEEFPAFPKLDGKKHFKIEQKLVRDIFRKTAFAMSTDETRYVLNGLLVSFGDSKLTVVATDGRRLALVEQEVDFPKANSGEAIVPSKAIGEVQRLLKDKGDLQITLTENQIGFEIDGTLLISKLIEGNYPNYRQVIPNEVEEHISLERETLLQALRRASLLTSEKSNSVKLRFSKNSLIISSNTPEVGEAHETIAINYKGKEVSIAFNPIYMMDCLRNLDNDEVFLDLVDELSPGVVKINGPFLYVLMPMRMN